MAMSRSTRITLLLVIDILFFFLELIVGRFFEFEFDIRGSANLALSGYAVGSLALVADSFHMLKYASFNNLNLQTTHSTRL